MIGHGSKKGMTCAKLEALRKVNFDLERMQEMVESETITKPEGLKGEELTTWLMSPPLRT